MAINSTHVIKNKIEPKELCGAVSQTNNVPAHVMTLTITTTQSSINSDSRCKIARKKGLTSPYLAEDKVKLSRVTEKKVIHKQPFDPSFPLATNIYKANSDEFTTSKRNNKKVKKSVLTLPNESSTDGIVGTVSDVNDVTEYNKDQRDRERKIKSKKRLPIQNRKPRIRNKDLYYDRDARYCSQMNIDLDSSSTDMIKQYNGDGRRVSKKKTIAKVSETESKLDPHDVWAVLRNINRFQFTPSPPMSDYSIKSRKKKRSNKKRHSRKDTRVIETCRTEEFAYISSFDLNRSHTTFSPTSSIDRITVIGKQDDFSEFCKEFENKLVKTTNSKAAKNIQVLNKKNTPGNNNVNIKRKNKIAKSYSKIGETGNQLVAFNNKKGTSNTLSGEQYKDTDKETVDEVTVKYATESHVCAQLCLKDDDYIKENADNVSTELELFNETICSVNSGSSKAGLNDFVNKKKAEKSKLVHSDESNQQLKGITKVAVVSKAPEGAGGKRSSTPMRKPRLVTTMPSSTPKLTQTEIKRRLANMKFPIVLLEKDELGCSSIEVPTFEPIQFRGLTEHIWPFMKEWNNDKDKSPTRKNNNTETGECTQQDKGKQNMTRNNNNLSENKPVTSKDKRFYNYNMKRTDPKRQNIVQESKHIIQQPIPKPKPMKQLKDKMLKLLYKKSVEDFTHLNNRTVGQSGMMAQRLIQNLNTEKQKTVDTGTDAAKIPCQTMPIQTDQRLIVSPKKKDPKQVTLPFTRHPWARGKWASDFIDSVIKKIKSGIYYNQENKILCKKCCKDSKEVSIQTALTMKIAEDLNMISEIADKDKQTSEYKTIPGFDDVLAPVEIKTLNMKQITVKHCLTNVLLQFDVCITTDKKPIISCESPKYIYTPLTNSESNAKIIKCKTSIINSIMPAELCSIIPKMMRNISDFNTNFQVTFPPILPRKQDFQLATITELTQPNSVDSFNYSLTPLSFISEELRSFLRGKYGYNMSNRKNKRIPLKKSRNIASSDVLVKNLNIEIKILPLLCHQHLFYEDAIELTTRNLYNPLFKNKTLNHTQSSRCMALQPYIAPKQVVAPTFDIYNVTKLLQAICFNNVVVNFDFPKYFPVSLSDIKITIHKKSSLKHVQEVSVGNKLKLDSIFDGFLKTNYYNSEQSCLENTVKCIEYGKRSSQCQDRKQKIYQNLCHIKTKKCFVKLYKKCKSTSNIALEKTSTALNKITNLDQFLQALGSGKLLSSIFDGYSEKKILSSIAEMKNWITDISQRQAMLVLLLTNKKDTPNLVRYRPVLLQGIAVNRITRASELDMEIEVIETENLNKLSHYEGISYVTASTQNNNLLEELYWIAKTTASDYQKPFNESSERLLKSLTEKRKMLNPSYLRVMARYVGLGLLKPPKK